jgi:hypothetical protein
VSAAPAHSRHRRTLEVRGKYAGVGGVIHCIDT